MNQEEILSFVSRINQEWIGPTLVVILFFTGIFFTIRLRFIQRYFFKALRTLFSSDENGKRASREEGMSPFQALSTAVASQVGTGVIVGVATALISGGPGALFWLWVCTLLGMSTNFAEAILGQLYKTKIDGHVVGGPAYYIKGGLGSRWLAVLFSIFLIMALGMIGIMVQANSIVNAVHMVLPSAKPLWLGLILAVVVGIVLAGGIGRIASFAEKVVPFMAALFMLGCVVFLVVKANRILPVLHDVFVYAFTPRAGVGGALGITVMQTIRYGVSRGLFINEAGLGSTPHAHAIAKVKNPYDQGMVALVGIGLDLLVCTLSALVMLSSGVFETHPEVQGVAVQQMAFQSMFGSAGVVFIAIALFFFALTTIIGWYFFAAQNVRYLFGERMVWPYRFVVMLLVLVAALVHVSLIWELADTFNSFLVIPNVIALIYLSPKVVAEADRMRRDIGKHKSQPTADSAASNASEQTE